MAFSHASAEIPRCSNSPISSDCAWLKDTAIDRRRVQISLQIVEFVIPGAACATKQAAQDAYLTRVVDFDGVAAKLPEA